MGVMPVGYVFCTGSMLTDHLGAGGCVSVAKLQKYFRMTGGILEVLRDGEQSWSMAQWNLSDMAREFNCMACVAPVVPDECGNCGHVRWVEDK